MNKQYINIAITGLSSNHSDELKTQLRNLIPQEYQINWSSAADPTIDCLFIHESFYETEGIQKMSNPITKNRLHENTISLPITHLESFSNWIIQHLLHPSFENQQILPIETQNKKTHYKLEYFSKMLDSERNSKLHLFDTLGTIAIIDIQKNIAWLNTEREQGFTGSGFDYVIASPSNFMKVSRKHPHILSDWLWQFFGIHPYF